MSGLDIRWQQRFQHYQKALAQLAEAVELVSQRSLSRLEKQGVIQAFWYTYELAWKTLKDFLTWQGVEGLVGSRDTSWKIDLSLWHQIDNPDLIQHIKRCGLLFFRR